jgi:hypothetical protein
MHGAYSVKFNRITYIYIYMQYCVIIFKLNQIINTYLKFMMIFDMSFFLRI